MMQWKSVFAFDGWSGLGIMAYYGLAANGVMPVTQVAVASAECFRFKGF